MIGALVQPELEQLIRDRKWNELREILVELEGSDIAELLADLPPEDEPAIFRILPRALATRVFAQLPPEHQEELLRSFTSDQMRDVVQGMDPDDQARLIEELPAEVTRRLIESLPAADLKAARDLLGYPPDSAGRYMTPKYVTLRRDMTAREALEYVRKAGRGKETLNLLYILDADGKLLEELRLGSLVTADPDTPVTNIEERPVISITTTTDREEVVHAFEKYDRTAIPVVDSQGYMVGIITVDDVLDVAEAEATEDMQKIGGMEALDVSYFETGFSALLKKRGGWLSALFLGEMLTATAMSYFSHELEKAIVLALFVPLIISSGGNSGSQAATLIIRSLAVGEMRLRDWWRVMRREIASGFALGGWLGLIGFVRVVLWQHLHLVDYGPHYGLVALTVWLSLIGVVMFGTLSGSMLPFILRRLGFDPATSSAPFVATLVDVTGLVIYFLVALAILHGTLL